MSIKEKLLELGPLGAAPAFLVAVLFIDGVTQPLGKGAQLTELILVGLALVFGRDAGVDGNSQIVTDLKLKPYSPLTACCIRTLYFLSLTKFKIRSTSSFGVRHPNVIPVKALLRKS